MAVAEAGVEGAPTGGAAGGAAEAGVIFVLEKASLEVAKVGKGGAVEAGVNLVLEKALLEGAKVGKVSPLRASYRRRAFGDDSSFRNPASPPFIPLPSPPLNPPLPPLSPQLLPPLRPLPCRPQAFLRKHGKDPALYRPDICHQALLAILDSPLNKAGRLKALYVATTRNTLIQVNPHIRIPRTFRRFCGLMGGWEEEGRGGGWVGGQGR
ncbi:unnamed protein product [Closterium sp. NIES-53]